MPDLGPLGQLGQQAAFFMQQELEQDYDGRYELGAAALGGEVTDEMVERLRERVMRLGGFQRTEQGGFWIDRDDVLRLLDEEANHAEKYLTPVARGLAGDRRVRRDRDGCQENEGDGRG